MFPAVLGLVMPVLHAVDHAAGAEEQERLEESVGQQVEGGRHVGADAQRGEHVAELRDGRVGQHLLDVVLRQRDRGGEQRREGADEGDEVQGRAVLAPPASAGRCG